MGEPLCQSFIDPLASTLPSSCALHNNNGSLKSNNSKSYTSVINIMVLKNDSTTLTQLKRLWDLIYNYSNDQGIRSVLLSCWLFMFPNEVLINEEPIDYTTIDPFFDGSLPQDRLSIDDPFEVTQKMEMKLRHGGSYKDLKLQEQQQGATNITTNSSNSSSSSSSSSSSNLKLSISLKKAVSPSPLNVKLNLTSSSSSSSSLMAPLPVSSISATSSGIALPTATVTNTNKTSSNTNNTNNTNNTSNTPVKPVLKFKFK